MKHDELLTMTWVIDNKIMSDQEHHGRMAKAVRAVVELHKQGRCKQDCCDVCVHCYGDNESDRPDIYPCPTIKAIVKGMDS